jgi:hypothetical protein
MARRTKKIYKKKKKMKTRRYLGGGMSIDTIIEMAKPENYEKSMLNHKTFQLLHNLNQCHKYVLLINK